MERDCRRCRLGFHIFISTHTLTWSVTFVSVWLRVAYAISTHTLTWSVTQTWETEKDGKTISTHTLTWSVTEHGHAKKGGKGNFNSHAHVERDG